MTEDESTRAFDVGEMYAVLPSIESQPDVLSAYRDVPPAPVGAYRSDRVEPLDAASVYRLVAETIAAEARGTGPRVGIPR